MEGSNILIITIVVGLLFLKRNELLSYLETKSNEKIIFHKELKNAGKEAMKKRKLYKKEEHKLKEDAKIKVDAIAEELDMRSNQKIKQHRLAYDIDHLQIITSSIITMDKIINNKLNNYLELSYNDFICIVLGDKTNKK